MREVRMTWQGVGALGLWALAAVLIAAEQADGRIGLLSLWACLAINVATVMTLIDWATRRVLLDRSKPDPDSAARLERIHEGLSVLNGQAPPNGHRPSR